MSNVSRFWGGNRAYHKERIHSEVAFSMVAPFMRCGALHSDFLREKSISAQCGLCFLALCVGNICALMR